MSSIYSDTYLHLIFKPHQCCSYLCLLYMSALRVFLYSLCTYTHWNRLRSRAACTVGHTQHMFSTFCPQDWPQSTSSSANYFLATYCVPGTVFATFMKLAFHAKLSGMRWPLSFLQDGTSKSWNRIPTWRAFPRPGGRWPCSSSSCIPPARPSSFSEVLGRRPSGCFCSGGTG